MFLNTLNDVFFRVREEFPHLYKATGKHYYFFVGSVTYLSFGFIELRRVHSEVNDRHWYLIGTKLDRSRSIFIYLFIDYLTTIFQ
jgi:hypothetical protein